LLSSEHFSVDGTLIEAWASMKSFRPKEPPDGGGTPNGMMGGGRNAPADFRGEKCKRRSKNPSLKRPGSPVAPE
jgi:hypothetical protein